MRPIAAGTSPALPRPPHVIGLIKLRDDWPLAAVAIAHALQHHVDAVLVLDHASSDATGAGLAALQASVLGPRLRVFHHHDDAFHDEAFLNTLLELSQGEAPDWIYAFDADEILLPAGGLRPLLASQPESILALCYPVENWVSWTGFDPGDLGSYGSLTIRSLPDLLMPIDPQLVAAIEAGTANFLRLPFDHKVIIRNTASAWLAAGAHSVRPATRAQTLMVHRRFLHAAHLPLLSRARLLRKAAMGRNHQRSGYPPWHGWQNQMLARIEERGGLEAFWRRHSREPGETALQSADGLRLCHDEELREALAATIALLQSLDLPLQLPLPPGTTAALRSQPLPQDLLRLALRASAPDSARRPAHAPPPDTVARPASEP